MENDTFEVSFFCRKRYASGKHESTYGMKDMEYDRVVVIGVIH